MIHRATNKVVKSLILGNQFTTTDSPFIIASSELESVSSEHNLFNYYHLTTNSFCIFCFSVNKIDEKI
jgi:hypothetical protein